MPLLVELIALIDILLFTDRKRALFGQLVSAHLQVRVLGGRLSHSLTLHEVQQLVLDDVLDLADHVVLGETTRLVFLTEGAGRALALTAGSSRFCRHHGSFGRFERGSIV